MTYTSTSDGDRIPVGEAASMLGVHPDTLRRWEKAGQIRPIRTPLGHRRYLRSDVEALLTPVDDSALADGVPTESPVPASPVAGVPGKGAAATSPNVAAPNSRTLQATA